jgi:hypothetical protein
MLVLACPARKGGVNPLEDENKVGYYICFVSYFLRELQR